MFKKYRSCKKYFSNDEEKCLYCKVRPCHENCSWEKLEAAKKIFLNSETKVKA